MSSAAMVTCGKPPQKPNKNKFQTAYDLFKAIEKIVEKADIAAANEPFNFNPEHELKRSDFTRIRYNPDTDLSREFIFGAASAAYQYEGATKKGGRGPSIWDSISENPGRIADSSNGNTAVNSYHQFQEDVKLLKALGVDYYRFSISWSRILPSGKLSGGINKEGVDYYNNLIDELLANGIKPSVTLFHFDTPQALEDHYGGFLDERIVDDFRDYARVCFWEFGDRVKHWATVNEPYSFCFLGYATGQLAPFRGCPKQKEEVDLCKYSDREIGEMIREVFHHAQTKEDESNSSVGSSLLEGLANGTGDTVNGINEVAQVISEVSKNVEETVHKWVKHLFGKDRSCKDHPSGRSAPRQSTLSQSQTIGYCEDPGIEPYKAAHNMLLAHAAAVDEYRTHFQTCQHGKIGLTMLSNWYKPLRGEQDKEIRDRALDFFIGWFLHPLKDGYYPKSMRDIVKDRLPDFTEEQRSLLIGSYDYIGVQYYTTAYATKGDPEPNGIPHCQYDPQVKFQDVDINDVPIGPRCGSEWLHFYPQGIRKILKYIKDNYNDPVIYITENGVSELNDLTIPVHKALQDTNRIIYHKEHLYYVRQAMLKDNVNVQGYFAWSFLDNFEWAAGYTVRFGMVYVDYRDECKRYPKRSACWYKNFLRQGTKSSKMLRSLESSQYMEVEDDEEEELTSQTSNGYTSKIRNISKRPASTQVTPDGSKKNKVSSLRM